MRVIISGAGGFLGRNLLRRVVEDDIDFIALTGQKEILKSEFSDDIRIKDRDQYSEIEYGEEDILINCAFPRNNDGVKMGEGLNYIRDLMKVAVDGGIGAVVNISSQSVYGTKRFKPAVETDEVCLDTPYAVGKYASELLTNIICKNIKHTNIRLASLIGPGFDQRFINKMIKQAMNGETITAQVGNQIYAFLDVRDAVDGLIKIYSSIAEPLNEVYNLGPKDKYRMNDIINSIKSTISLKIEYNNNDTVYRNDINANLFYNTYCWRNKYSITDSINWIYNHMRL